jgi:hypothetical protein
MIPEYRGRQRSRTYDVEDSPSKGNLTRGRKHCQTVHRRGRGRLRTQIVNAVKTGSNINIRTGRDNDSPSVVGTESSFSRYRESPVDSLIFFAFLLSKTLARVSSIIQVSSPANTNEL